jgi:hypothetical protein
MKPRRLKEVTMKHLKCLPLSLLAGLLACSLSAAEPDSALERYLLNRFPTTKFEKSRIVKAGVVLLVQRDGIGAISPSSGVAMGRPGALDLAFPNSYKGGSIHHDGKSLFLANTGAIRDLYMNEPVYVLKIDIKDTSIVFNVQSCGACDPSFPDPEHLPARANVTFQLGKPYLSSATPAQVEEIITHVFAPAQGNGGMSNQSGSQYPTAQPPQNTLMAPIPPPPPPDFGGQPQRAAPQSTSAPAEVKIGQTTDQVTAALGQPLQIFNLGAKVVYKYQSLKVTFVNGKVSDVE